MSLQELDHRGRSELAHQMRIIRALERGEERTNYNRNRGEESYDIHLAGYSQSLDYVRRLRTSNIVLDVGAGTTRAISEIAKTPEGEGLDFWATTLAYLPAIEKNLGKERTHITPVEILRGVEDNSVGLVLAVYSITYSVNPTAAIDRIDQVLVPGGIFKGKFNLARERENLISRLSTPRMPFEKRLRQLGYNIALGPNGLILAKKPGGNIALRAQDILEGDRYYSRNIDDEEILRIPQILVGNAARLETQE